MESFSDMKIFDKPIDQTIAFQKCLKIVADYLAGDGALDYDIRSLREVVEELNIEGFEEGFEGEYSAEAKWFCKVCDRYGYIPDSYNWEVFEMSVERL